jgi:hypothetical protein
MIERRAREPAAFDREGWANESAPLERRPATRLGSLALPGTDGLGEVTVAGRCAACAAGERSQLRDDAIQSRHATVRLRKPVRAIRARESRLCI